MTTINRFKTVATTCAATASKLAMDRATAHVRGRFDNLFLAFKIIFGLSMAVLVLVVSAILFGIFNHAQAADYSEGYRMGVVTKFSSKGFISKSWEGQMLLGRDGSPYSVKTEKGTVEVNPWRFSADNSTSAAIQAKAGDYVWIKYTEDYISKSITKDTPYTVIDIQSVTRKAPVEFCLSAKATPGKSDGLRVGRIVKMSSKGTVMKSNEILFQMGNSGNQFKAMSISDIEIAKCAIDFLKSGQSVKIFYTQSAFNTGLFDDTSYNIYRIEVLKDL